MCVPLQELDMTCTHIVHTWYIHDIHEAQNSGMNIREVILDQGYNE